MIHERGWLNNMKYNNYFLMLYFFNTNKSQELFTIFTMKRKGFRLN